MRNVVLMLLIVAVAAGVMAGQPRTILVPQHVRTIQGAIDLARASDTVLVSPGVYTECIDFKGKNITVRSSMGPELTTIKPPTNINNSVVTFNQNESNNAVLEGFTITGGHVTKTNCGGGLFISNASPTIRGNIIIRNIVVHNPFLHRQSRGGGIYIEKASRARILDNTISYNKIASYEEAYGAGIMVHGGASPFIMGNYIFKNELEGCYAYGYGGGVFIDNSSSTARTKFVGNVVVHNLNGAWWFQGAGIRAKNADLINNTIADSFFFGWGTCEVHLESCVVENCIIWNGGNTSYADQNTTINNSTFNKNGISGSWTGSGNIYSDPKFVDRLKVDYHLRWDSPCRNRGNSKAVGLPPLDFEGDPRIAGGTVDMGADEFYPHLYHLGNSTPGGRIDIKVIVPCLISPVPDSGNLRFSNN